MFVAARSPPWVRRRDRAAERSIRTGEEIRNGCAFVAARVARRGSRALERKMSENIYRVGSETASAAVAELAARRVSEGRPHRL
jgi:hypothetical protein